jgi:hypothetical protein
MITAAEIKAANAKLKPNARSIKAHLLVRDLSIEADGVWIYLQPGWCCATTDMNAISEDTIEEATACLRRAYFDAATID